MIEKKDYKDWKNTIILAPNASGKSRLARKLFEESNKNDTKLFSLETINDLVTVDAQKIFLGLESKYTARNENIKEIIEKSDFLKKFIKSNYNLDSLTAKKIKEHSLFFSNFGISNMKSLDFFINLVNKEIIECEVEDDKNVIAKDKQYDIEMLKDIKERICDKVLPEEILNESPDITNVFSTVVMTSLTFLKDYMEKNSFKKCILCGTKDEKILDLINENLSKYIEEDKDNIIQLVNLLYERLKIKCPNLYKSETTKEKMGELISYYYEAKDNEEKVLNIIMKTMVNNKTLLEYITEFKYNQIEIAKHEKTNSELLKFTQNIREEFKKLVTLPENIVLDFNENVLELKIDNQVQEISKVLSTSELKRLALAVLNAEIESSIVKYIIFDDPIDSYDDYYIRIASIYISKMIYEKDIKFTIFTHLYELCYYISLNKSKNKFKYTIYYQDPTFKISDENKIEYSKLLQKHEISAKYIENMNKNELIILKELLRDEESNDVKFVLLSMFTSIRSLTNDVNNIQKVTYKESKVQKIVSYLEETYIHFSNKKCNVDLFYKLKNKLVDLPKTSYCNMKKDGVIERRNYLSDKFTKIKVKNLLLKIALFKMLRIQECKYLMEEKLVEILKENKIDKSKINTFILTHELGRKIEKAKSICSDERIEKIENIHFKYQTLINDYSHGFTRMFPPYLMTSSIDLAKLEYDIDKVDE